MVRFIDVARDAVAAGVHPDRIADLPVRRILQRIGEEFGEARIAQIRDLWKQLDAEFSALRREHSDAR